MLKALERRLRPFLPGHKARKQWMKAEFKSDGLAVNRRNIGFLRDGDFVAAWSRAVDLNREGWHGHVPDIRWRAHTACWAAQQALTLDGDFVECGVHTGLLSLTVCDYLGERLSGRPFWLFDTFEGMPVKNLSATERAYAEKMNREVYFDVWDLACRNFAPYPNVKLVRGFLPDTLARASLERVAYLSIDLNNVVGEKAVIEALWPKLVLGGLVLLDDYAYRGYELQHDMWDVFAASVGRPILTLPTGQGLLIK